MTKMSESDEEVLVTLDNVNQDEFNLKANLEKCTLLPLDNECMRFEVTRTFNAWDDKDVFIRENELIKLTGRLYDYTNVLECTVSAVLTYDESIELMKHMKQKVWYENNPTGPVITEQAVSLGFILFPLAFILLLVVWSCSKE